MPTTCKRPGHSRCGCCDADGAGPGEDKHNSGHDGGPGDIADGIIEDLDEGVAFGDGGQLRFGSVGW